MIPLKTSHGILGSEELPVTMQVGMIGANGIVLAGDTRHYVEHPGRCWHSYNSSKIKLDSTKRMAIACARSMDISFRIAEQIFAALPSVAVELRADKIEEIGESLANGADVDCVVAFADPSPSLFFFQCAKSGEARCEPVDKCAAGDVGNPAYFWAERYYRESLPVNQLVRLASHIVVAAGNMNNGSIRGLEIVTLEAAGFRKWSVEENRALESEIMEEGRRIGEMVLNQ